MLYSARNHASVCNHSPMIRARFRRIGTAFWAAKLPVMVIAMVANSPRTGVEHSGSRVLGQLVPNQLLLRTAMLGCFVGWTLRYLFFISQMRSSMRGQR